MVMTTALKWAIQAGIVLVILGCLLEFRDGASDLNAYESAVVFLLTAIAIRPKQ